MPTKNQVGTLARSRSALELSAALQFSVREVRCQKMCSRVSCVGSRFGGALDGAAEEFTRAYDKGLSPRDFVDTMRKENKLSK